MDKIKVATIAAGSAAVVSAADNLAIKYRIKRLEKRTDAMKHSDRMFKAFTGVETAAGIGAYAHLALSGKSLKKRIKTLEDDSKTINARLDDLAVKTSESKRLADLEAAYKNFFDMTAFNTRLNGLEAKMNGVLSAK